MKKSSKVKYFIVTIGIVSLVSPFIIHYFKVKGTPPKKYAHTETSQTKSIKEVSSDPLDQIKEYGEKMKEWTNIVTEMNGILEDVKSTVHNEAVANK